MIFLALITCFVVINVDGAMIENNQPQPYRFGYTIKDKEGVQTRAEAGNGAGVVEGNYGFVDNKGLQRQVNYVADQNGFRATIKTNEPGTAGQSPADVHMMSNDPYAQGAAVPYVSRVDDPVVPALYESDGAYGFPTMYRNPVYDGRTSYAPSYLAAYGQAPYAPVLGQELATPINNLRLAAPLNDQYLSEYSGGYGNAYIPVAPLNYRGQVASSNDGYMPGRYNGALGYGDSYGPEYMGGLTYSNILGAGYRNPGGNINFGANLVGGQIRGFDSRFTNLP